MAVLRLDIQGTPREVLLRSLLDTGQRALYVLGELDAAFSERRGETLDWLVNDLSRNGSLTLEIHSVVRRSRRKGIEDVGERVTRAFVDSFTSIEHGGDSPPYLTERGMANALRMAQVAGVRGAHALRASVPHTDRHIEITAQSAENLRRLIRPVGESIGSVEGKLEGISLHRGTSLVVYQAATEKAVTVRLPKGMQWGDVREEVYNLLGKRVSISGRLRRNQRGEPVRIEVSNVHFRVLRDDAPSFSEIGGSDKGFTGSQSTQEFLREGRG